MVSADAARELLEGSTPGPWCAGRSSSGSLCIAQMADPGEDVAVALDAIFADAALMAAAPDLARTVVALHERVAAVEAERDAALAHAEELTQALRETQRERDAMKAIIEGRTTPPTDEEIASHHATRGRWYVADHAGGGEVRGYPPTVREIAGWHRERAATWRWCALDSHGRPCAWPGGGQ